MKNNFFARVTCLLIAFVLMFGTVPVLAKNAEDTIDEENILIDGILAFKMKETGCSSVQQWIDGTITENAGLSSEWYVFALSRSGKYDFSSYKNELIQYLENNSVASASSRQKYALVLMSIGSNNNYIATVMEDSIGKQGVMSFIYGLHLLNNGAISSNNTIESVKQELLSMQLTDGGWAIMGTTGDNDVTAMAIQALAPHYENDANVKSSIDKALEFLSARQLEDGDYGSYGVPNLESTAQVVIALSGLGIDGETDDRFIKNENTLLDGLEKYKLSDGSFSHTEDSVFSDTATVQALQALVSYVRMTKGEAGLYVLDDSDFDEEIEKETAVQETIEESIGQKYNEESLEERETQKKEIESEKTSEDMKQSKLSYKTYVCVVIMLLSCFTSLIFFVKKKKNKNNFLVILMLTVLSIVFVQFTDFQSVDDYYNGKDVIKENVMGTVTLTIRCDTVLDKLEEKTNSEKSKTQDFNSYIPSDGVVLETTTFDIEKGDTVYDILIEAAQKYGIQIEHSGADGMVYIAGINYLYEFDFGEFSGWMYHVNGEEGDVGCAQYELHDKDVIEWLYTCELGKDLK